MTEREFIVPLDLNARMRVWHRVERRRIRAFTIQLEILSAEQWWPMVRYDTTHNFAHRDLYTKDGKQLKTPLGMDFNQARTFAQKDILDNWQEYRKIFLGE
jgi:hypothetical protein